MKKVHIATGKTFLHSLIIERVFPFKQRFSGSATAEINFVWLIQLSVISVLIVR